MKRVVRAACAAAFLLVCAVVLVFLHTFTRAEDGVAYLDWASAAVVSGAGAEEGRAFDPLGEPPTLEEGEYYCFTTVLPERSEGMELFFEVSGMELTLRLDGVELYYSAAPSGPDQAQSQVQFFLPAGGGETLTMDVRTVGDGPGLFPPLPRLIDNSYAAASNIAYANLTAFPAGAAALALVLVWGMFLQSAALGRLDWNLLPLLLAAAGLMTYRLVQSTGAYFLPRPLLTVLSWPGLGLLTAAALVAYLLMNRRRRSFWRAFGWAALWSAAALLVAFLLSLAREGYLARYLISALKDLTQSGVYDGLLYWLTQWLTLVCILLSAWDLMGNIIQNRAQARAAQVKYRLTLENYQQFVEKNRQTAQLRHEWNNQLVALSLLVEKGDLDGLAQKLDTLESELGRLSTRSYSEQSAINAILQNAAYRAEQLGIDFRCQVLVPRDLQIDEGDLCSLLLNMLDNAMDAAARVAPPRTREVSCKLKLTSGFLAVWCQNTYNGVLRTGEKGELLTDKEDTDIHGFGLPQMRAVAAKYQSILDIDYDGERFTVQTALKVE